ncbi:PKD domain-containing protein [Actinopolymorpha singaporensis]|uniref:PKD domain-containing protein n=1 Tax=Actinopolymorpha singaporensis TaxID=117157 RepID=A0A1H1L276_9ACTN|nr:PKD domain-containing protein [Actinopolymorpha singaporensis]SDR68135.1 PKD domain-containing protein [Actinopolymorpha singaporensis]
MRVAAALVLVALATVVLPSQASAVQVPQSKVVSDNPVNWTPHVLDGRVMSIVQVGGMIILGGEFSQVSSADGTTIYNRSNLVAFSATTGVVSTTFNPRADGEVTTLIVSADGSTVFAGGFFNTINGQPAKSTAKINVANGQLTAGFTSPVLDGRIKDMRLVGSRLWIAGTFTRVNGHVQPGLATINATTGAYDPFDQVQFAGPQNGGVLQVMKMDVTPDRSTLVAIGNFTVVGGQSRTQIAMLDIGGASASVANWRTDFFTSVCSPSFDSYMRDIDISPDGTYFVVTTTGAYSGGPPKACDTNSRFETRTRGTGITPTWAEYTGGDTTYAVAVTGAAVYVGGHFRWHNNPWAADKAGPGAVSREGIAALDPQTGLPFQWNPGRTKGVGVFDMLATSAGLWVGSDTDRLGNWEYHARIGFLPIAGGTTPPRPAVGTIPGDVYVVPTTANLPVVRAVTETSSGPSRSVPGGGIDWTSVRGAFMLGNQIYTGWSNGVFNRRTFDGTSYGTATPITLADQIVNDTAWHNDVAAATGMFWKDGRLYYTVAGSTSLYYRRFTVESYVVGAQRFIASASTPQIDFSKVTGMFYSNGRLYWGSSVDGNLRRVDFLNDQLVSGTVRIVSGPSIDGLNWRSRAMFVSTQGAPAVNDPPVAVATGDCRYLVCTFSGTASHDSDGTIAKYSWDFGDGTTGDGATVSHTFATAADQVVRLTVTDDKGATSTTNYTVTTTTVPTGVEFVGVAGANGNATAHKVTVPSSVQSGDRLLLLASFNDVTATISGPTGVTGWSDVAPQQTNGMVTRGWQKVAAAGDAGTSVTVTTSIYVKGDLTLLAYRGDNLVILGAAGRSETASGTTHTTPTLAVPAGTAPRLVSYWAEKSSATTALTGPAGQEVRRSATGTGGGHITTLATESTVAAGTTTAGGLTATADSASAQATMWSFLIGARS